MKVILAMADTLRRDHLGVYGNNWIHTPNLDRLAAQACVFEHAYIGSFPTVPTRRDIFLGHGDRGVPFNRWKAFEQDEITLAERLAEYGLHSMMITDVQNNVTRGINMEKGFSAWHCLRGQEGDPCWSDATVPLEFAVPPELIRYPAERWHQILMNRAYRKYEEDWQAPATYAAAIRWLERNYQREHFFLYVDTFDPHEPWDPPDWYEKLYDEDLQGRRFEAPTYGLIKSLGITPRELHNIRARYAGEITMMDAALGRFLAALERLGLYEDALLICTSDHGAYFGYPGDNGLIGKPHMTGSDGRLYAAGQPPVEPLQYYPHYTGVSRIPLIMKLPKQQKQRRVRAIVQPWDLTPTILEAFGVPKPPEFWGESLLPLACGDGRPHRQAAVMGLAGINMQVMTPQWLYAAWRGHRAPVLLDLQADPRQKHNLHDKYPDVVQKMRRVLHSYLKRQGMEEMLKEYA